MNKKDYLNQILILMENYKVIDSFLILDCEKIKDKTPYLKMTLFSLFFFTEQNRYFSNFQLQKLQSKHQSIFSNTHFELL